MHKYLNELYVDFFICQVRWDLGLNKKTLAHLSLERDEPWPCRFNLGEELLLKHPGGGVEAPLAIKGTIIKISPVCGSVTLEIPAVPSRLKYGYSVDPVYNPIPSDRELAALRRFATDRMCMSWQIRSILLGDLGHYRDSYRVLPAELSAPNLPTLNRSQLSAVRNTLSKPLSLIQGKGSSL